MGIIGAIISLWRSFNGHKFNTGAAVTVLATVIQQAFASQGVSHDQSVFMATAIVQAVGVVIMIAGYIHQWIKSRAAKAAPKTEQQQGAAL
jgi:protein-S-isoprenylcysteine O-methyltransferase Ste14